MPTSVKIAAGVVALLVVVWGAIAAIAPSFTDPKNNLARIAKRVTEAPKSEADARQVKTEFDESVRNFLKQNGNQPAAQLSTSLQQALNEAAFEVHVFELPRGLSVVEIDTILQASDYLIQKGASNSLTVTPISGMEVFENGKIISDHAAPVLVILGHTGGQGAHRPLLKVLSLLPDNVIDQTAKSVPELKTEGTASFAGNNKDVNIDYSLMSLGTSEHLFSPNIKLPQGLPDEPIHGTLRWNNGHYEPQHTVSHNGQLSILYAVGKVLSGGAPSLYDRTIGRFATSLATKPADTSGQEFTITASAIPTAAPISAGSRRHRRSAPTAVPTASYLMQGKSLAYIVDIGHSDKTGEWTIIDARKTEMGAQPAVAAVTPPVETATVPNSTKAPDDKIITATPKVITPEPTETVEKTVTKQPAKDPVVETTKQPDTSSGTKQDKTSKQSPDKLSMVQTKKTDTSTTKTPPATPAVEETPPETQPQGKSEGAVGIGASVSDKIEVANIKVRSGPGTGYKQLSTLSRGAKIKVIGKTSGWYKVRVNGQDGYVYGGFVDYKTPDAYETLTVQKPGQLTDEHSKKVGDSKAGERLVVLGANKDGKVRVQLSSGKTAYINKDTVEQKEELPQFVP